MAWSVLDAFGMFSLTADTEITLELDPRYEYKFEHLGRDSGGNDDANSQKSAWLSTVSGTITADKTVEDEKLEIVNDGNATIGPGVPKLYVVSTSGADAAIQIVRRGSYDVW